jgi:limonene-1,2-epoxide hydrolase
MLAIKANYLDGKITFLESIPDEIKKAKLTIVIEPDNQEKEYAPTHLFTEKMIANEAEFEYIGLAGFFENENDRIINWEDYFGLK